MKVLDVYSKKDLDRLTVKGKVVSKIMDDFFKNYPESYRENYDIKFDFFILSDASLYSLVTFLYSSNEKLILSMSSTNEFK